MSHLRSDDDANALLSMPVDADLLDQLHRRLEQEAEQAELMDVVYTTIDSPLGELLNLEAAA